MSWLWFALIPVAFLLHRKWNKKIDREERESYGLSSNSKEENVGSWGVTQRFQHYLDFQVSIKNTNMLVISNSKGESFSFIKPLTDTLVEYKQNNRLIKDWKFPFWVHPNKVYEIIDNFYKIENSPIEIISEPGIRSVYKQNGRYGLWNSGISNLKDRLTDAIYDEIDDKYVYARSFNRYIKVAQNGLCGILNIYGQKIISCKYNYISAINIIDEEITALKNDLMLFEKNGIQTEILKDYINQNASTHPLSVEELHNKITFMDSFVVSKGLKYGVVGIDDIVLLPFHYDEIIWVNDLLFIAKKDDRYGVIWGKNKVIIPFEYIYITHIETSWIGTLEGGFESQLFRVKKDSRREAIINGLEKIVIPYMSTNLLEAQMKKLCL